MTQTPYEAGRLFANNYAGKKVRLCLAVTSGSPGLTSTTAQWDAAELSGNGYARAEWTVPSGSYSGTTERFEVAAHLAQFTASAGGTGLSWDSIYLVIGTISGSTVTWNTGVSFVLNEDATVNLAAGESHGYNVTLFTDGFLVTA
jgi:hypothetical protein